MERNVALVSQRAVSSREDMLAQVVPHGQLVRLLHGLRMTCDLVVLQIGHVLAKDIEVHDPARFRVQR